MLVRFRRGSVEVEYVRFLRRVGKPLWERRVIVRALLDDGPIDRYRGALTKARAACARGGRRAAVGDRFE